MAPADRTYVFDNAGAPSASRFAALTAVFDPSTFAGLDELGVGPGWQCLDVGAGNGTVARWLAERVGADGRVVATDIDTRHLDPAALLGVEILHHDVTAVPLPDAAFDLIHARLVLHHLPARDEALHRLVDARARMLRAVGRLRAARRRHDRRRAPHGRRARRRGGPDVRPGVGVTSPLLWTVAARRDGPQRSPERR